MKIIKLISKGIAAIAFILFASLFIFANWSSPRMAHQAPPSTLVTYKFTKEVAVNESNKLHTAIKKIKGVTACTINTNSKLIGVAYNPLILKSSNEIVTIINNTVSLNIAVENWNIDPNKPQCPVPAVAPMLDNIKMALCIRKS